MDMVIRFKRFANGANTAIHHVAGGDDVYAGFGLHDCLLNQDLKGDVVDDVTVFIDDTVLAMAGVWIECDIG